MKTNISAIVAVLLLYGLAGGMAYSNRHNPTVQRFLHTITYAFQ